MGGMFCGCSSLTSLDISKCDINNVINMKCIFCECSSLSSLDISKFKTNNNDNDRKEVLSDLNEQCMIIIPNKTEINKYLNKK